MNGAGGLDTRRVQTAVVGDEHSDDAVVLPFEAIEVDGFERARPGVSYWCGMLLGGCGSRLTIKHYTDRACHFAHVPPKEGRPRPCLRAATNHASADHLFIKAQLGEWLAGQGLTVRTRLPETGRRVGSVVDVEVVGGVRVWVHLDERVPPRWPLEEPGERRSEVVVGPSVVVSGQRIGVERYVHRVHCEDDGAGGRRVMLGTQTLGYGIRWFELGECRMTAGGLVTPAVEEWLAEQAAAVARAAVVAPVDAPAQACPVEAGTELSEPGERRIEQLRRQLASAQKAERVGLVRDLVLTVRRLAQVPQPEASAGALREILDDAERWIAKVAKAAPPRATVFASLRRATLAGDRDALKRLLRAARALCRGRGATGPEAADLVRAKQVLSALAKRPTVGPGGRPPAGSGISTPARSGQTRAPVQRAALPKVLPAPRDMGDRMQSAPSKPKPPNPQVQSLATRLRAALENDDVRQLVALSALAKAPGFPSSHTDELRQALTEARERLDDPVAREAIAESRRLLTGLARTGNTMTVEELSASFARLEDLAATAGRLYPPHESVALASWRVRLASMRQVRAAPHPRPAPTDRPVPCPPATREVSAPEGVPVRTEVPGRLEPAVLDQLADEVRQLLEQTARDQSTTTWTRLRQLAPRTLPRMVPDDQGEVLVRVDATTPPGEPLLSALVTTTDHQVHPLYRHICFSLDRPAPLDETELHAQWAMDVLRLHQAWRYR